jgi:O-antigen/teichoic acid export membrane protein
MAEVVGAPVVPDSAGGARPHRFGRAGLSLAVATVLSNLLGYAFAVVLSRALGPGDYGALAALLALGLIGSVPAIALQLLVAREVASSSSEAAAWVRTSLALGAGLLLALCVLSPVASAYLDLGSALPVIWIGVALLPTTVAGALQGLLLGRRRYGGLAASYLLLGGLRFAGGCVAAAVDGSVSVALAAAAVGTLVACLLIARITAAAEPLTGILRRPATGSPGLRQQVRALTAAASATAAILVLTNLDVVLARHFLSPSDSGQYGVGALFAKAAFWAPHFLAVLVFPVLAGRGDRRRSFLVTTALTLAIGGVVVLGAVFLAGPVVEPTVGSAYAAGADLAPMFAVLGVLAAVLQLLLFAGLARRTRRAEAFVWAGIGTELVLVTVWFHDSGRAIVVTAAMVSAALTLVIIGDELRTASARDLRRL